MKYRYFPTLFGCTLLLFMFSHSALAQVKFIEVNINQPGLAECQATSIKEASEKPRM